MTLIQNNKNLWWVYIIKAENGFYYTGITKSLQDRFEAHCLHKKGAKFFRMTKPEKIVYFESHSTRSQASIRENSIKKMTRPQKLQLIESFQGIVSYER